MVTAFEYVEDCNRKVLNYGWIEFPLAYTQVWWLNEGEAGQTKYKLVLPQNFRLKRITPQVATFSVYAYFAAALFGRQFLEPRGEHKSVMWLFTFYCIWGVDLYRSIVATSFQTTVDQFPATTRPSRQFRTSTLRQVARLPTTHQVRLSWVLISSFLKTNLLQVRTNRRAGSYIWESGGSAIYYIVYLVDSTDTVGRAKVVL